MLSPQSTLFVVGFGSIGKALAVFLKLAGRDVVIIRGSVDDGSRKIKRIRIMTANGVVHQADLEVSTLSTFNTLEGIVVLASKSYGNQSLSIRLRGKTGASPLVLLQNGLGVERPFIDGGFPEIYRGVLFVTSQPSADGSVQFRAVKACALGMEKGRRDHLDLIANLLHTEEFAFEKKDTIQPVIWEKAIVNCVFNSVCPLLDIDNGVFHRNEKALRLARLVIAECTAIASEKGIPLSPVEVEQTLLRISQSSEGQLISTLLDIRHRRETEIESLTFEIVRTAVSLNREQEVRVTRILGELTALKADLARNISI